MTDVSKLPDDIKEAFSYFIKRTGELELSSFLLQTEVVKLIKIIETLKQEKLQWEALENKLNVEIDQYRLDITKYRERLQAIDDELLKEHNNVIPKKQKTKKNKTK